MTTTEYVNMIEVSQRHMATMMEFMQLKGVPCHLPLYESTMSTLKMLADFGPHVNDKLTLADPSLHAMNLEVVKAQIVIMSAAIYTAQKTHPFFNVEKANIVQEKALQLHNGETTHHSVLLWSDGEVTKSGKMLEPPILGLSIGKLTFPGVGFKGTTFVAFNRESDSHYELRSLMIGVVAQ